MPGDESINGGLSIGSIDFIARFVEWCPDGKIALAAGPYIRPILTKEDILLAALTKSH